MKYAKYAALVTTLLVALTGCGNTSGNENNADGSNGELTTLRLGVSPFQDTYLPVIGEEKGWFEEAGLNVEMQTLAWNSIMPAVISDSVDLAVNNTTGVIAVANTAPDVAYAYGWNPFTEGAALMIRPEGELNTIDILEEDLGSPEEARTAAIEQLEGKTIVTTLATDMGKAISDALASVGMDENDVNFVDMDPDAGLAAFLTGTGDAYLGGVPQRSKATDEGMLVAVSGPDLAAPPINGIVGKRAFIEDNEDTVLAFLNVMHRIIRYCDAETDACGQTITDRLNEQTAAGLTLDGFKKYWQNIELYAPDAQAAHDMILSEDGVAYWKETWTSDNNYMVDTGAIPAAVEADSHFLMPQVWKEYVEKYGADETGYSKTNKGEAFQ